MTFKSSLTPADLTAPHYGHDLFESVDHAYAWPVLRGRRLTEAERTALLKHAERLHDAVDHFTARLTAEHGLLRSNGMFPEEAKPPYIPEQLTDFILAPLSAAQRALEEHQADDVAVAYLRIADVLARLLHTWRDQAWEEHIDAFIIRVEAITKAAATAPHFTVLASPTRA